MHFRIKCERHANHVASHFMYYNFVQFHKALRITPALAGRVTDKLWELADVVIALTYWENRKNGR
jgi:hypothetical protein